jgi:hypothetical protein
VSRQRIQSNLAVAALALISAVTPARAAQPAAAGNPFHHSIDYLLTGTALVTCARLGRRKHSGIR